jgi:hypothetical protein
MKNGWKRIVLLVWDNASFHISKKMTRKYVIEQRYWLTTVHLPKRASYLNPNERKVNQR